MNSTPAHPVLLFRIPKSPPSKGARGATVQQHKTVASDETLTRAHIHKAAAGSNGGIHWDFLEAGNPVANVAGQPSQLRGVGRPRAAAVVADLLANPSGYYFNVHSTAFPGGAVRGQVE